MKNKPLQYLKPSFFIFLVIAALLWYVNKLSGTYLSDLRLPIEIENDFSARMWIEEPNIQAHCRVEGAGTKLMNYKIRVRDRIVIPMSRLSLIPVSVSGEDTGYKIDKYSLQVELDKIIKDLRVIQVLDSAIYINVSPVESRRMAVQSRIGVEPAKQHMQIGQTRFTPDSVDVRGPKVILDSMQGIWTRKKEYTDLKHTVRNSIALQQREGIMISQREVNYHIRIQPYTQSTLEVPVRVLYLPDSLQSMTVPSDVSVVVNVPLKDYDRLKEKGLAASIDYRQAMKDRGTKCAVRIDSLPGGTEVVKVDPQFVEPFFSKKQ